MIAVEVRIAGASGNPTPEVTMEVRETDFAGSLVGSSTQVVNLVFGEADWNRFEFAPPLSVTPDATYMLVFLADAPQAVLVTAAGCPSQGFPVLYSMGPGFPL